jgi:hypothetical protein
VFYLKGEYINSKIKKSFELLQSIRGLRSLSKGFAVLSESKASTLTSSRLSNSPIKNLLQKISWFSTIKLMHIFVKDLTLFTRGMLAEGNFNICELRSRNLAKRFDTPSDTIATEDSPTAAANNQRLLS